MPFQSTIDRSVGKLIKSFRNRDYFGANRLNSAWKPDRRPKNLLNVPTAVHPTGKWNLSTQGDCVFKLGINYAITVDMDAGTGSLPIIIHVWGSGGGGGRGPGNPSGSPLDSSGGGGGYVSAPMDWPHGTTYNLQVGNAMGNAPGTSPWGEPGANGNPNTPGYDPTNGFAGGGYTAFYEGPASTPNIRLLAGGGGCGGFNDGGKQGKGGGGGSPGVNSGDAGDAGSPGGIAASSPFNGEGASPTAGGAAGTSPHTNGSAGGPLVGGGGGARGGSGAAGGSGGSGWYGGGGGAGQTSINSDGGGGGGGTNYVHPSLVPVATSAVASDHNAANNGITEYWAGDGPPSGGDVKRGAGGYWTSGQPESYTRWAGPGIVVVALNN